MNIIDEMRAHVEATGHEVRVEVDTRGQTVVQFSCQQCSTTWETTVREIGTMEHPLLDQPGSIPRILNFVNSARNPTAWDHLKKSDDPV